MTTTDPLDGRGFGAEHTGVTGKLTNPGDTLGPLDADDAHHAATDAGVVELAWRTVLAGERATWELSSVEELRVESGLLPVAEGEARAQSVLMIPPAVSVSGEVLAGARQVGIARALGLTHLWAQRFEDVNDPALLARVAWEAACEEGTPSLKEQSAYLNTTVRPAFEAQLRQTRTQRAAHARSARWTGQTLDGHLEEDDPAEDSASVASGPSLVVSAASMIKGPDTVAENTAPLEDDSNRAESATLEDASDLADSAGLETPAAAGSWREWMDAHLVGVGRNAMEQFQKMEEWAADPALTDRGRLRIQKEIDAANTSGKVNRHYRAAEKIHLAETATEEERRNALWYRTQRQFDDIVTTADRFASQHPAKEHGLRIRQSGHDVEALREQVAAMYRVLAWLDEVAEHALRDQ